MQHFAQLDRAKVLKQDLQQLVYLFLSAGKKMERMVVKPETALVRPFVVCAILRGVALDENRYKSFIDLQAS